MYKLLKNIKGVKKTLNKKYGKSTIKNILFVVGFLVVLVIGVYLGKLLNKSHEGFEGDGFFSSDAIMSVKDMDLNTIKTAIETNATSIYTNTTAIGKNKTDIAKNANDIEKNVTAIGNINTTMENLNTENLTPGSIIPYYPKNNTILTKDECIELLMKGFIPCDINVFGTFDNDNKLQITSKNNNDDVIINGNIAKDGEFIIIKDKDSNIIAKIPNLSRKFIVGAGTANVENNEYDDYNIGTTGGSEKHQLKIEEMPRHDHKTNIDSRYSRGIGRKRIQDFHYKVNVHPHWTPIDSPAGGDPKTGKTVPHENRPPFMAMVYIYYLGSDYRYIENSKNYELMKGIAEEALA